MKMLWMPILVAAAIPALASVPEPAERPAPSRWTADDIVRAEAARALDLSPDGKLAVWVRTTVEEVEGENRRVSNLWLTREGSAEPLQLTRGADHVSEPRFSPDGATVAFLSDRSVPGDEGEEDGEEPKARIWAIPAAGGEAFPVTRLDRDVREFRWRDARTIVFAAEESPSLWEKERKEDKDRAVVVDDAERTPPVRLFEIALEDESARRITRNTDWIDSLSVSPDGKRAVVTAQRSLSYEYDQKTPPRTLLLDLETRKETPLFEDGRILPRDVRWAADGSGFYLANDRSRHPLYRTATVTEVWFRSVADGRSVKVDLGTPRGLGDGFAVTSDGFVALLHDGVRFRAARFVRDGDSWKRSDLSGEHVSHLDAIVVSRDGGTIAYAHSKAVLPTQWYAARLDGAKVREPRRLTDLNEAFEGKPTGRAEVVRWAGANEEEVEGILYYPFDWKESERRPLILDIHGGPTGVDRDSWSLSWASAIPLWRQKGAFVLQVNYHGSVGYGLDWVESIGGGKYYELEIPDIEKGVDALIERGLVDAARLATTGWSNGGILSVELITRTRRYRAASIGAADVEWISDWGFVDFGASFDNYYFGASPLEDPKTYVEKSPFFRLPSVTTPAIVFTGTDDRNVPPGQSWSLFRALQQTGKTDVRLVLFPGEPHGLGSIAHQKRKIEEEQAWFDRHLFGTQPPSREAVKKGSPIEALLARAGAARADGRLGRIEAGVLVPETVPFEGLEVGRFEVTRAQLAAFDPAFAVAPGEESLPATGISIERARDYVRWLADRTGRPFRLPTAAEAERIAKSAGRGGNTLDRWAGYEPNPEDAARLFRLAEDTGRTGVLLLPVGSVPGTGAPVVFDLDGNAAEWSEGKDGTGIAAGASADRPSEDLEPGVSPSPGYVGLRVVVGTPSEAR